MYVTPEDPYFFTHFFLSFFSSSPYFMLLLSPHINQELYSGMSDKKLYYEALDISLFYSMLRSSVARHAGSVQWPHNCNLLRISVPQGTSSRCPLTFHQSKLCYKLTHSCKEGQKIQLYLLQILKQRQQKIIALEWALSQPTCSVCYSVHAHMTDGRGTKLEDIVIINISR